ncbi:flagellar assembly factor FliW [Kineothrix alysoides]|uniref:Flagellar assembly factor FliW n=1 Tax=Kineothrix alysoides TaxID=1469948 RepID=A0A4R1QM66_9FIRM|nr:flagellar assembly protein FliW [Kineothrix alysoides]TCL54013.1 flagellar assembly factor FliW [Kineothrix alysoides]
MIIQTKAFGEITIDEEKVITFPKGIVGFSELTKFTMIHDKETGAGSIHWLQSLQEPAFAMPVMDPLVVKPDYNPEVEEEWIKPLGELDLEELLVLVTVTVPQDLTQMTVNLKGPIVINTGERKACQVIIEGDEYQVKYPIYDILQAKKAGE